MPYFSVVIPVYNTEAWIEKTLKAVLGQTFSDFEIILVDDGSTDNSVSIADSFHTQKLKIIKQCNSGVSVARNAGIAEAKGKYIAFLDADDYWFDDHLAEAKNFFDTFDNYPWYSSTPIIREEKDQLNNINRKATKYYFINFVSSGAKYTHSSSVIIRNDIAKQHPFPVGITNFEDVITFMQISVETWRENIRGISLRLSLNQSLSVRSSRLLLKYPNWRYVPTPSPGMWRSSAMR